MTDQTRRGFLQRSLAGACVAGAAPLLTPVTLAAAPGENRLVVVILRGGMDGLGVFAPYGDPDFARLRPSIASAPDAGLIDLDGRFGMDQRLRPLMRLWRRGQLAVAHAVSTPYRDKRSHFDGQDILEAGVAAVGEADDGWMNRALRHLGPDKVDRAISVGREDMLLMRGELVLRSWAPGARLSLRNDDRRLLDMIYAKDPLFAEAALLAEELSDFADAGGKGEAQRVARYAAERLSAESRIAAFSISGWDTHSNQRAALKNPLDALAETMTALEAGLGENWDRTLVVAMTEFGRTARENGNRGTDHGTGGAAILAGGAVRGGKVLGDWPGLKESDLYAGRDLTPTMDVRRFPAWSLSALYGLERSVIERDVFPGLDMGPRPDFIA